MLIFLDDEDDNEYDYDDFYKIKYNLNDVITVLNDNFAVKL